MKSYLIYMMGGKGERFGAPKPKQFIEINDVPVFLLSLREICELSFIDGIVVVVIAEYYEYTKKVIHDNNLHNIIDIVIGGESRSESVFNGLKSLKRVANIDDVVLMYDSTHPIVDKIGMKKVIEYVCEFGAASLVSLNYDTTYMIDDTKSITNVLPRKHIVAGASPEGFRFGEIYQIYQNTPHGELEGLTSVGAIAISNNIPMRIVPANVLNLKLTFPDDLELFKILYKKYPIE